jgi:ubiquinone/menaquinone biosynthesis C-methylase UbiE
MPENMKRVQQNIVSEFDKFSGDYTSDMTKCVPHYLRLIDLQSRLLPESFSANSILDLGCGNGNVSVCLQDRFPLASFTLVDISPEMLELCRLRMNTNYIKLQKSYFHELNFAPESFDLIVAGFSIHHIPAEEKIELFKNLFKWLKIGGLFSYSDLMIDKDGTDHPQLLEEWKKFVLQNYSDEEKWLWLMEHYDAFDSPSDYRKQIEWLYHSGFTSVKTAWQESYWTSIWAFK